LYYWWLDLKGEQDILADADFAPCASSKKELIAARFALRDTRHVIVVFREIECWYLAGLGSEACRDFRVPLHTETHHLTKEVFDGLIPRRYDSRIDWMNEILKRYSLEEAKSRNTSFKYFADRLGLK
jgi:hypothetical protein